ncbi:RNA metabolism protein [Lithospermum erythrorhizon]|uniref:RNA metabolism protein n=1 Tax=Lithospermum erythrorhizon TaxID=34254 RepID=A0AAV3QC64_LITER
MFQLEGDIKAVKKGLIAVTRCLQDYALVDSRNMNGGRSFEPVIQDASFDPHMGQVHRGPIAQPKSASYNGFSAGTQSTFEEGGMNESRRSLRQVIFNILCPTDKVGGVLGKGGSIVRDLQSETGATISIGPSFPDCPERLITIAALENPESRYSPAQSAVVLVFNRFLAASPVNDQESYSMGALFSARIVVPSNVVGCLLGKGGAIISEMRKVTGAALRVIGCDQVPKCAMGNVEIVQITGALTNVQNAIYNVTTRLRENLLPLRMLNGTTDSSASSFLHKNSPSTGVRGHPVPECHPSHPISNGPDQQSSLVHHMDQLRLGQTVPIGSQRSNGGVGIGSGSRSAVVMNSTLEIVVPDDVVDSIYGKNGSNLSNLRQVCSHDFKNHLIVSHTAV